jgi:hypothetical protein
VGQAQGRKEFAQLLEQLELLHPVEHRQVFQTLGRDVGKLGLAGLVRRRLGERRLTPQRGPRQGKRQGRNSGD